MYLVVTGCGGHDGGLLFGVFGGVGWLVVVVLVVGVRWNRFSYLFEAKLGNVTGVFQVLGSFNNNTSFRSFVPLLACSRDYTLMAS